MQDEPNVDEATELSRAKDRHRVRQACEPCKIRKRKCDGTVPCQACRQHGYQCHASSQRRRRSQKIRFTDAVDNPSPHDAVQLVTPAHSSASAGFDEQSMQANSGVLFPQLLNADFSTSDAPKLQGLGWNLGLRYHRKLSEKSITWILSKEQWDKLFNKYHEVIHCEYSFLDLDVVQYESAKRWSDPTATNSYDHVLCGIAALASSFVRQTDTKLEKILLECAKDILYSISLVEDPNHHDAQAWLLRLLYQRCNSLPHAAWMTSCTTMQILEATGLHKFPKQASTERSGEKDDTISIECQKKTYWLARMLNFWISNEYGRTTYNIVGASCPEPIPSTPHDHTTEFLIMFRISLILQPDKSPEFSALEQALRQCSSLDFTAECLSLSRANLCFTIYRRLRLMRKVNTELSDLIISIGRQGLQASLNATRAWTPWWHVSNVPFQFLCVLLTIDTPKALSCIHEAVSVLREVVDTFQTPIVQSALKTVEQLIQLLHLRKQHDAATLGNVLARQVQSNDGFWTSATSEEQFIDSLNDMWPDDILWNSPSLNEVDWNQLLNAPT